MRAICTVSALLFFALSGVRSSAVTITFDDLPLSSPSAWVIHPPDGYGGLDWSFGQAMNVPNYLAYKQNEGTDPGWYANGLVSGDQLGYTGSSMRVRVSTPGDRIALESVYLTAAWYDRLLIEVEGFAAGVSVDSRTLIVGRESPTFVDLGFEGVDEVWFRSFSLPQGHFTMDDLTYTVVPEPGTALFVATGLVALAVRRRGRE